MGLGESKGSLHVCVDKADYAPGEEVTGSVYLYLRRRIKTETVWLKLKCTEETHLGRRKGLKHWVRQRFALGKWPKEIPAGSYSLPFRFTLPTSLPCSFKIALDQASASITYKLKAQVSGKNSRLKHHLLLPIHSLPLLQPGGREEQLSHTASCCRNRGVVKLIAGFERASYTPGLSPSLIVEVDNSKGSMQMSGLVMRLYRLLKLKDDKGKANVWKWELLSLQKECRIPSRKNLLEHQAIMLSLSLETFRVSLTEAPTVNSTLIECHYLCEVSLQPAMGYCWATVPQGVSAPVTFVAGKPGQIPLPMAPEDWNPTVLPSVDLSIGQQYEYSPSALLAES